jgi:hypothetical protein
MIRETIRIVHRLPLSLVRTLAEWLQMGAVGR